MIQRASENATKATWAGLQPLQIAENFLQANTQEERLKWQLESAYVASIVGNYYRNGRGASETMVRIRSMDDIETEEGHRTHHGRDEGRQRTAAVCSYYEGGSPTLRHCSAKYGNHAVGRTPETA